MGSKEAIDSDQCDKSSASLSAWKPVSSPSKNIPFEGIRGRNVAAFLWRSMMQHKMSKAVYCKLLSIK